LNKKQWLLILLGTTLSLVGEGVVITYNLAWYWAVGIFIIAFICCAIVSSMQSAQRIQAHFAGRPILGETEFGGHYFAPDRAEIATKLRKILANHVGIDISRMNPADRFIEDLQMDDFDSMATVEYVIEIEKEFGIEIPNEAAGKMNTFQNVVDYVAEAVKSKAN
jgi:acyl carrier protein